MKLSSHITLFISVVILLLTIGFVYGGSNRFHKEIAFSGERELKANLQAGFAKLNISRGSSAHLFDAEIYTDRNEDVTNFIDYSVRDRVGYLNLNTDEKCNDKKKSIHISKFESSTWNTTFSDAVPISFDVELGLGSGIFNLTGLSVKDLNLSVGASEVTLRFDEPNKSMIDDMTIEAGLSKFVGRGLSNANFKHMKFEGGVGSYTLDFDGTMNQEADADIEVGLGSLIIIVPRHIGVKVMSEKSILTHMEVDKDFTEQREDNYFSSNYYSASGKINFHIEAGLGSVKIMRER